MPTGHDYVAAALETLRIPGIHYDQAPTRCSPQIWPHATDCSGLTSRCDDLVGLFHGCEGSFAQMRRAYAAGTQMSIEEAFRTPGAWLAEGVNNGRGGVPGRDPGHIGISVGDNYHSLEARGHWAGTGLFVARSLVWTGAGMPPGVSRGTVVPPPPPPPVPHPNPLLEDDPMGMIALPATHDTVAGRVPTARVVKAMNFVLLEDGAHLAGATRIDAHRHWWAPASGQVPGWQIIDIADLRPFNRQELAVRYGYPNGDAGTYIATIIST